MTYDDELEPEHDEAADGRFRKKAAKHKTKKKDGRPDVVDEVVEDLGEAPGNTPPPGWHRDADGEWEEDE